VNRSPGFTIASRFRLNSDVEIPVLGLGVFQSPPGATTRQAVRWALEIGYRHIDTASMYGNESDVGEAVRESRLARDEVFVTTKLWPSDHGFEPAQKAARKSLERLDLSYIDLYLIHWPRANSPEERLASWRAFERLRKEGVCRAIGVSNYTVRHLKELAAHSDVTPAVNQVEFHPFVFDPELFGYCQKQGIRLEAWAPLTRGRQFDHPVIRAVANAHHKTPAQVLIRWGLEHGVVEIPKSVHRERIEENARVFDFALAPDEMARLDALRSGARVGLWNPADIP
jgi:diketogulonate reductase-like aldo/keto reductase